MNTPLSVITEDHFIISDTSVTTNSFKVAEAFDKQHKHILEKIKSLECSTDFTKTNFRLCFKNNELQNGKPQPYYKMTKDGFIFLVMGFTGKKAAQIKEAYINAFNYLLEHRARHTHPREARINSQQLQELRQAINNTLHGWLHDQNTNLHIYNRLRVHFHLQDIGDLTEKELPLAVALVESLRGDLSAYYSFLAEFRQWFHQEVIGNGVPWTPHLMRKWKKQFTEQLPARPDWQAIEKQLKLEAN